MAEALNFIKRKYIKYPAIIVFGFSIMFASQAAALKVSEGFFKTLTEDMVPLGFMIAIYGILMIFETIYDKIKKGDR